MNADQSPSQSEAIQLSRSIDSNEESIDLTTVLQQARNPILIIDRGDNSTSHSVFRISSASQNPDGSFRYHQYVMNEHSQSNNSGTIDLSEVLATAAAGQLYSDTATNTTFVRLPQDESTRHNELDPSVEAGKESQVKSIQQVTTNDEVGELHCDDSSVVFA